ncbi:MAG TPA: hypothetical protein VHY09_02110, partial [Candidatus Methylacidiphilales bacterium]|nr:hypothetical protein [Candidatus Methylacidiphilales bacterium]
MPADTKPTAAPAERASFPGSWLEAGDRKIIAWALGGTLLFALVLGAVMFALMRADISAPDPDAATPVIAPDYPRHLVDFTLTDQSGRPVTRAD